MKNTLKSYTTFTRTERIGLVGLSALLVLLIAIRAGMSRLVHPATDTVQQQKLLSSWQSFKRCQPTRTTYGEVLQKKDFQDASDEQTSILPDTININTADSATLVRLKGIGPATAQKIVERRRSKPFTNISQLSETGAFSQATLDLLKPHIAF